MRCGRIAFIHAKVQGRVWTVYFHTPMGLDFIHIRAWDDDTLEPLEGETIQIVPGAWCRIVYVSGRRFSVWRSPEVMGGYFEYSRVYKPADPRELTLQMTAHLTLHKRSNT